MAKRIEIIPASNPQALKEQLEEMVNNGWEIKGVIGYNPHNVFAGPYVIMEGTVTDDYVRYQAPHSREEVQDPFGTSPEPPREEISISVGG
jgi:hypothetical protein